MNPPHVIVISFLIAAKVNVRKNTLRYETMDNR